MITKRFLFVHSDSAETVDDLEDTDFPSPREDLRELGRAAMAKGELDAALNYFTNAVAIQSKHSDIFLDRAACYEAMKVYISCIKFKDRIVIFISGCYRKDH